MKKGPVLLLIVLLGCFLSGCGSGKTDSKGGGAGEMAVPVAARAVQAADLSEEKIYTGQIAAEQSVFVSAKGTGRVAAISVQVGDTVKPGSVLFQLDAEETAAQVKKEEAAVAVARARLEVALKKRENARVTLERYEELFNAGAISKEAYEARKLNYEEVHSREYEAVLSQSEANLAYQRSLLEGYTVKSPIMGTVSALNIEVGQYITSSTQAVQVVNLSRAKVKIFVGEQVVSGIRAGQEVKVEVPAVGQEPFMGQIASISPAVDSTTKNYPVEIRLDNPGQLLKQGMFARISLVTGQRKGVVAIPREALITRDNGQFVFLVKNNRAVECRVSSGITDGKLVEVSGNIKPGDQVVVVGQQALSDGFSVQLRSEQNEQAQPPGKGGAGGAGGGAPGGTTGGQNKGSPGEGGIQGRE